MAVTPHQARDGKHDRCERFVCLRRFSFFPPPSFASPESNKKNFGAPERLQNLCWNS